MKYKAGKFPCPYCDGTYEVSDGSSEESGRVIHTMPMCETYRQMNILDFIEAAEKQRGNVN